MVYRPFTGWQPGELGVGHALGDEDRRQHDPGDDVGAQPPPLVGAQRRHARHVALHRRHPLIAVILNAPPVRLRFRRSAVGPSLPASHGRRICGSTEAGGAPPRLRQSAAKTGACTVPVDCDCRGGRNWWPGPMAPGADRRLDPVLPTALAARRPDRRVRRRRPDRAEEPRLCGHRRDPAAERPLRRGGRCDPLSDLRDQPADLDRSELGIGGRRRQRGRRRRDHGHR